MASMEKKNLVKDFECSLQTCITTLLCQENTNSGIPNKNGLENSIEKFLESAKDLEGYFAKCQMYNSVNNPHDTVREEIIQLNVELAQKDILLDDLKDKASRWNEELRKLTEKQMNMYILEERKKENK